MVEFGPEKWIRSGMGRTIAAVVAAFLVILVLLALLVADFQERRKFYIAESDVLVDGPPKRDLPEWFNGNVTDTKRASRPEIHFIVQHYIANSEYVLNQATRHVACLNFSVHGVGNSHAMLRDGHGRNNEQTEK